MMNLFSRTLTFFCLAFSCLFPLAAVKSQTNDELSKAITVDLREPVYCGGVITTDKGGIICGPDLRIQAMHLIYTRKLDEDPPIYTIIAEQELMLEFGDYVFVGDRLEYDFITKTGVIYNGRTMVEPWCFGGDTIYLCADGSYLIHNAFVTTSENYQPDWQIVAQEAELVNTRFLYAKNVQFRVLELPVFWIPSFRADLDAIFDSPIRYNIKWGSRQGHRFGMVYELFSWNRWKTFLRLDYRLKRGPGGGLETYYRSLDHRTIFQTINYVASDSSIIHPGQRLRYRFQGIGDTLLMDDKISVHLSYDKLSDIDMPTDYNDRGLELDTAGRTELLARRQEEGWIANLITRLRINNFQTIKQELPTFETTWHPFELGNTGIVNSTLLRTAYLDFAYGNNQLHVHDYRSSRFELTPLFYRHFQAGQFNLTPEIGGVGIAYGNSPNGSTKWLALGKFCCTLNTNLYKQYTSYKHVITPYATYEYYTTPTVSPNDHYIFDIDDGWYRLDMLCFGFSQSLYHKHVDGCIQRKIFADIYTNAFFGTRTIPQIIPKIYADFVFNTFPTFRHILQSGWDLAHNEVDHYNVRTEWTVNSNIALAVEFRHRSAFDWRKVDHTNFILDSFRTVHQLHRSQLSDRRDTLLFHLFYRFHPNWAFEFESRSGWNRRTEPSYNEFEIDLLGTLRSAWNIRISYQHREDDDRFSVYMTIGIRRPDCSPDCIVPCLGF